MNKKINIKVTKTLTNILNKKSKYNITFLELSEHNYKYNVDLDIFKHENDYNYIKNKYNVICIEYPYNYYACNKYLTTNDLTSILKKLSVKNLDNFINAVNEYIEI